MRPHELCVLEFTLGALFHSAAFNRGGYFFGVFGVHFFVVVGDGSLDGCFRGIVGGGVGGVCLGSSNGGVNRIFECSLVFRAQSSHLLRVFLRQLIRIRCSSGSAVNLALGFLNSRRNRRLTRPLHLRDSRLELFLHASLERL